MWWKIVIIVLALFIVNFFGEEKTEKKQRKKRLYKFLMGITYLLTAAVSLMLVGYWGNVVYIYTFGGVLFGVGAILSAINTNLREMYLAVLFSGFFTGMAFFFLGNYRILCIGVGIYFSISIILSIGEGIYNMCHGIDPDVVEAEKKAKKKVKNYLKLTRMLIRHWF